MSQDNVGEQIHDLSPPPLTRASTKTNQIRSIPIMSLTYNSNSSSWPHSIWLKFLKGFSPAFAKMWKQVDDMKIIFTSFSYGFLDDNAIPMLG